MKNSVILLLAAMSFVACVNTSRDSDISAGLGPENITQSVFAIPDSLCTPQQIDLKQSINDIHWKYTEVQNNRLVFTGDKELFTSQGIPPSYYDIMMTSMRNNNEWIDKWEAEGNKIDMKEVFGKSQKAYFEKRGI